MPRAIVFEPSELRGLRPLPSGRGCDFCAFDVPSYRYPARAVGLGTIVYGSTVLQPISRGVWEACGECADLIEAGDWPVLARRSLRSLNLDFSHAGPGFRVRLLAQIRAVHESFRHAKSGPRGEVA